jgi:general secretion pathway protein G
MKPKRRWQRLASGYTMIELLVVLAILGVLAAAVMPLGETLITSQKERELRHALVEIRGAIDDYKRAVDRGNIAVAAGDSGYPPNLTVLVQGVPDARALATGKILYFLRVLPRDPFADPAVHAEQTWLLRSHASPPDRPEPGLDVYDVRSSSSAMALDGSYYARW